MAHTKSGGSTTNVRDSKPKYLGIKLFAGEKARVGHVILRQRGTRYLAGDGVRIGRDHTLFAARDGMVEFSSKRKTRFDGSRRIKKVVTVK